MKDYKPTAIQLVFTATATVQAKDDCDANAKVSRAGLDWAGLTDPDPVADYIEHLFAEAFGFASIVDLVRFGPEGEDEMEVEPGVFTLPVSASVIIRHHPDAQKVVTEEQALAVMGRDAEKVKAALARLLTDVTGYECSVGEIDVEPTLYKLKDVTVHAPGPPADEPEVKQYGLPPIMSYDDDF